MALLAVNDHVDITMITGLLNDYVILEIPGNNEPPYWTVAPADDLTVLTVVGPSFIAMVKRP